jgi:hypothetical protein
MTDRVIPLITPNSHQAATDWALASALVGGAYAFQVDLYQINQVIAMFGGFLGVALGGARLYYFLKEKWGGTKVGSDLAE